MTTYTIVRQYARKAGQVIKTGLTFEDARTHCSDPETSSVTCQTVEACEHTVQYGPWFDAFYPED